MSIDPKNDFEKLTANVLEPGFFVEFRDFLRQNKKWWLLPIVVVLLFMAILVALAGTPAAPFIYTLF